MGRRYCIVVGCEKKGPSFNFPGCKGGLYCKCHQKPGMENVVSPRCEKCKKQPQYNFPGTNKGRRCAVHAEPGMIDVKTPRCIEPGCNVSGPAYNLQGQKKGVYCFSHKKNDMIDVVHRQCEKEGCTVQPTFNTPGLTSGRYCSTHRLTGMTNVVDKKCEFTGCDTRPSFNLPGLTKARFCVEHKSQPMINVNCVTCEEEGCQRQPVYNIPGETKGRYCVEHKDDSMVDVMSSTCEEEGCSRRPNYNSPGETKGRYCVEHKADTMIDVTHPKCQDARCSGKRAKYGLPGHAPSLCSEHRQDGCMRNSRSLCSVEKKCREPALYGYGNLPVACEEHKSPKMFNLIEHKCTACGLLEVVDADGLCGSCSPTMFRIVRLAKQKMVQCWLDAEDMLYEFTDRRVPESRACELYTRPDFLFDAGTHFVVLEVDERQHTNYECENARMINMTGALGLPTMFVRFNPDDYKTKNGCPASLNTRRDELLRVLKHHLEELRVHVNPDGTGTFAVKLYYDGDCPERHIDVERVTN